MQPAAEAFTRVLADLPLARMWNQRYPEVPARAADAFRSAQAIVQWLGQRS